MDTGHPEQGHEGFEDTSFRADPTPAVERVETAAERVARVVAQEDPLDFSEEPELQAAADEKLTELRTRAAEKAQKEGEY